MDILIKNLEIPKEKYIRVEIHHDGTMYVQKSGYYSFYVKSHDKAIALTPHGDLIDRNKLPVIGITDYKLEGHTVVEFEDVLNAPVIVEANNE